MPTSAGDDDRCANSGENRGEPVPTRRTEAHTSRSQPRSTGRPPIRPENCSAQPLDFHRSPNAGLRSHLRHPRGCVSRLSRTLLPARSGEEGGGRRFAGTAVAGRCTGRVGSKTVASIDFTRAARSSPRFRRNVDELRGRRARAGGVPAHHGGQAIGEWLRRDGQTVRNVHRVLKVDGYVSDGFRPAGPGVPADQERVRDLLSKEGVTISARGRASKRQRFHYKDWH